MSESTSSRPLITPHRAAVSRRARRSLHGVTTNLTPMIDIVFNLLIFFLVGASFKVQEGLLPSKLPETAGLHAGIQIPLRPIRIRLNRTGDALVSEDCDITVENLKQGVQPYNFAELHAILGGLKQRAAYSEETPVILIPEGSVKYGHVINAYNAASRAQFKSISFAAP